MCTNKLSFKVLLLGLICIIMFSFHLWMAYPGLMNISANCKLPIRRYKKKFIVLWKEYYPKYPLLSLSISIFS